MIELRSGRPVERVWVLWHGLIGLGAGILFLGDIQPPLWIVLWLLITSLIVVGGVQFTKARVVTLGLVGMAGAQVARSLDLLITRPNLGAGNRLIAVFVWGMLAVGAIMEAYSVRKRGIA